MTVTANITVSFGEQAGAAEFGHLSAEIDDRPTGLNGGNTSFAPGDTAYFLVYQSSNVSHDTPIASAGSIVTASVGSVQKEVDVQFPDTDTASLPIPADSIVGVQWLGRSLGSLALQDEQTVKASAKGVAVARVTISTTPSAYGLQSPGSLGGETDFSVLVFIQGHLDED